LEVILLHEYGVTESIINIVNETAKDNNAKSVKSITLVIGELSSIIDDSVQMYFDALSKGSLCEGAKLIFKRVTAKLECRNCKNVFERVKGNFNCPKCGQLGKLTDIGKEFYIESIEVE
jgi:hydrogenase nickel incorporation protein HypA/HybF